MDYHGLSFYAKRLICFENAARAETKIATDGCLGSNCLELPVFSAVAPTPTPGENVKDTLLRSLGCKKMGLEVAGVLPQISRAD